MKAAVYKRISDDREGRELGVTRQHDDCAALAAKLGATIVETYEDNDRGASTRSRKRRKEYERLIADAKAGRFQMVIAYTSGRLTRRPRENEDLIELAERYGIQFRYVASPSFDLNTAAGRRIARILAATDAGEAEDIAERVQRETLQRAEQGRPHGGKRPYGYARDERSIVPDEAERIRGWYAVILAGGSMRSIQKGLERDGVLTDAGRPWNLSSIRAVILNERNAGLRELDGQMFTSPGPPIVSEETWRAAAAILTHPTRRREGHSTAIRWLGAGLYICDRCADEAVKTSYNGTAQSGVRTGGRRIYKCNRCYRTWTAEPIDAWVTKLIAARLTKPDLRDLLAQPDDRPDVDLIRIESMAARERLRQLAEDFAEGVLTAEQIRVATERLRTRIADLDAQMASVGQSGALDAIASSPDPSAAWLALDDIARRQAIVRALVEIRLGAPIRGRAKWDAEKFIRATWVSP